MSEKPKLTPAEEKAAMKKGFEKAAGTGDRLDLTLRQVVDAGMQGLAQASVEQGATSPTLESAVAAERYDTPATPTDKKGTE